jgi:hypothetical protein
MNEKELKQWQYAKSLEIAALILGPYPQNRDKDMCCVMKYYEPLQWFVLKRIRAETSQEF